MSDKFVILVTLDEANSILSALGESPSKHSLIPINFIHNQLKPQIQRASEVAAEAEKASQPEPTHDPSKESQPEAPKKTRRKRD